MVVRKYDEELQYLEKLTDYSWRIKKGFQVSSNIVKSKFAGFYENFKFPAKYERRRCLLCQ